MAFRQIFSRRPKKQEEDSPLLEWLVQAWNVVGQVQEWIEIGGSGGEPAFQNSWVNLNTTTHSTAAFYKDPFGRVHLKGVIKDGTLDVAAFTLPAGYRPSVINIFGTVATNLIGRINIQSNGNVIIATPTTNTWVALDGISFRAEQ